MAVGMVAYQAQDQGKKTDKRIDQHLQDEGDKNQGDEIIVELDMLRAAKDERRALAIQVTHDHQVAGVLPGGRDHRMHVLALPLGQDQAVEVVLKTQFQQFGRQHQDAEQRGDDSRRGSTKRVNDECDQHTKAADQVRLEDRARALEGLPHRGQPNLANSERAYSAPFRSPSPVGPRGPISSDKYRTRSSQAETSGILDVGLVIGLLCVLNCVFDQDLQIVNRDLVPGLELHAAFPEF